VIIIFWVSAVNQIDKTKINYILFRGFCSTVKMRRRSQTSYSTVSATGKYF